MQRREAIQKLAVLLGGISLTPQLLAAAASRAAAGEAPAGLPADRLALLAEMADTIIPTTDTPGAKAAGAQNFIALVVEECMKPQDKAAFWAALEAADRDCTAAYGKSFVDCSNEQRTAFFTKLEQSARTAPDPNFWRALKALTIQAYFTSEIGMTQALAYDPIPGEWIPDMKIDDNTKAWASMF